MNRYVFNLILHVEKAHSSDGVLYRDAYFFEKSSNEYPMINKIIKLLTLPHPTTAESKPYSGKPFINFTIISQLFKKIRVHFELTKGLRGAYFHGYKKHAYEVACTVGGIMDILFFNGFDVNDKSIETIIRQSGPNLDKIDDRLEKMHVPFLFRQLFKGLSKEDQLFLIPKYR